MMDYQTQIWARESVQDRINSARMNHVPYQFTGPTLREQIDEVMCRLSAALGWAAALITKYQGQRAPVARRLAANRN